MVHAKSWAAINLFQEIRASTIVTTNTITSFEESLRFKFHLTIKLFKSFLMSDIGVQLPDFFNAAEQLNGRQFWKD
jgi:hypothetical protein